jgi:GxxExxY protein
MMIHRRAAESAEDAEVGESGLTHAVIGAAIEVHRLLGPGLLESVYQSALGRELWLRGIPFEKQVLLPIEYKGSRLEGGVRLDVVVARELVVEIKAVDRLAPIHRAQLLTYLKLSQIGLGLLINFNVHTLRSGIRRIINSQGAFRGLGASAVNRQSARLEGPPRTG